MATIKQKTAIKKTIENLRNNNPKPMGKIMLESGYKPSVAQHPKVLTESKAWVETMKSIDYSKHLRELDEMASTENNQDKDNVLRSKDMLFKLGDKYPASKSKIVGLFEKIGELSEDPTEATE